MRLRRRIVRKIDQSTRKERRRRAIKAQAIDRLIQQMPWRYRARWYALMLFWTVVRGAKGWLDAFRDWHPGNRILRRRAA